ncbi:MAG TPA: hypothetical protein VMD59_22660 [Acidimicrobiales bacterium]|nr:hypothetical protein [Acidimicrobiales bacterium]
MPRVRIAGSSVLVVVRPYDYAWSIGGSAISCPGGGSPTLSGATSASPTFTVPCLGASGTDTLTLAVTDALGDTTTVLVPVTDGTPPAPVPVPPAASSSSSSSSSSPSGPSSSSPSLPGSTPSCSSLLGVLQQAINSSSIPVVKLGPVTVNFGKVTVASTDCSSGSATFSSASFSVAGNTLQGTNLAGSISVSPDQVHFTSGTFTLPASFGLSSATISTPIDIDLDNDSFSGSLTFKGLPVLHLPSFLSDATTTVSFGSSLQIAATASVTTSGGNGSVAFDATFPLDTSSTTTATLPGTSSCGTSECASLMVTNLAVLGLDLNGQAMIDLTGANPPTVTLSATGTPSLTGLPKGVSFTSLDATWTPAEFTVSMQGTAFGGKVTLDADGDYEDAQDWSLTASATPVNGWKPLPQLSLTSTNGGSSGFTGTVSDSGGDVTVDLELTLTGSWTPVSGVSVTSLDVQLTDADIPPACDSLIDAENQGSDGDTTPPDDLYVALGGNASISLPGSSPATVAAGACVDLAGDNPGDWALQATSNLQGWKPVPAVNVELNSVGFELTDVSSSYTMSATGTASILGATCTAKVTLESFPDSPVLVVDGTCGGSVDGISLPGLGSTHVILSSGSFDGYDVGSLGLPAGAGQKSAPDQYIDLSDGLSLVAGFSLPSNLSDFVENQLLSSGGVSAPPPAMLITANLGSSGITLSGELKLNGKPCALPSGVDVSSLSAQLQAEYSSGICLFDISGIQTSLAIESLSLQISLSGTFAIGATAQLAIPGNGDSSSNANDVPPTLLELDAELEIDLTGPSITASFALSAGAGSGCAKFPDDWCNAFGLQGLDLANLVISGGIDFGSGIPTPTIGFGATVDQLPAAVQNVLGINPADPAPITFVVNISATAPVFQITLGAQNGQNFLYPLWPIAQAAAGRVTPVNCPSGSSLGCALGIEYANLVIAPNLVTIGPYTYQPGFNLQFDGEILNTPFSGAAILSLGTSSYLELEASLGSFTVGGLSIQQTSFTLALSPPGVTPPTIGTPCAGAPTSIPSGLYVSACGGLAIGSTSLDADLTVEASPTSDDFTVQLSATANDIPMGPITIDDFDLYAEVSQTSLGAPNLQLGASGEVTVLGDTVALDGSVDIDPLGSIDGAQLVAGAEKSCNNGHCSENGPALTIGGVSISGSGCSTLVSDMSLTIPSSVTLPTSGPCVALGFDALNNPPVTIGVSGSFSALGSTASFTGFVGSAGLAFTGGLTLPVTSPISGTVSVAGAVYFGPDVSSATPVSDPNGDSCTPSPGDFYFTTGTSLPGNGALPSESSEGGLTVFGFPSSFSLSVGSMSDCGGDGSETWMNGSASVANIDVSGSMSDRNGTFRACFTGTDNVTLGGVGIASASVTVAVESGGGCDGLGSAVYPFSGLEVDGSISLGSPTAFSANLTGEVSYETGSLEYCLNGNANLQIPDLTSTATAYLYSGGLAGSTCDQDDDPEGLSATAKISADNGALVASGTVGVDTNDGSLSVSGSGTIDVAGQSFAYTASFCTGEDCSGWNISSGLAASFSWDSGTITFSTAITGDDISLSFSLPGNNQTYWLNACIPSNPSSNSDYVCATASFGLTFTLDTASNTASFDGTASFSTSYNLPWPFNSGSGPSFGPDPIDWSSLSFPSPSVDFGSFIDDGINDLAGILGIDISLPITFGFPL